MNKRQKARKRAWMKRVSWQHREINLNKYFKFNFPLTTLRYFPELKGFY